MQSILLTGGTGFVGQALISELMCLDQYQLTLALRKSTFVVKKTEQTFKIHNIDSTTSWGGGVKGRSVVIHCAARVHIMDDKDSNALVQFRNINVEGTLNLANQAAAAGVKRFIFISSIKVNGEGTDLDKPFTADDESVPVDPYGITKKEAEEGLKKIAGETGMEVVIIRPPLVYGPGVKANFARMIQLVDKGLPLPLGAIHNKRSLVALDNLVDLIITCIAHPAAANQVFLAGDGEDLSTTELLQRVAKAMDKPSRLIPVPEGILRTSAALLGKKAMAQRLLGSLQVDISKARNLLGWEPPISVDEGLKRAVDGSSSRSRD